MPEKELQKIAENAKIIVNGYAFSKRGDLTDKEITIIQKFIQAESYFSAFPSWIQ